MYDTNENFGGCGFFMILIVVACIGIALTGLLIALANAGYLNGLLYPG